MVNKNLKSILIEINDKFEIQKNKIIQTMKNNKFELVIKKRNENYYKGNLEGIYNYIFQRIDWLPNFYLKKFTDIFQS